MWSLKRPTSSVKVPKQYFVKILNSYIFCISYGNLSGWFRVLGVGLRWKHRSRGLSFMERNGFRKYVKIGEYIITYLNMSK